MLKSALDALKTGDIKVAESIICLEYPFVYKEVRGRKYTDTQKIQVFIKDGFLDRYTGEKLINPGFLKVLSFYFPNIFPYQAHWKMTECHNAYWEFCPTVDHVVPIAWGGTDDISNWVSTSMIKNAVKSNWTLEQLGWRLYDGGNIEQWDGLTRDFIDLVEKNKELLSDAYIKKWYKISLKALMDRRN
ncbi:MAG: HNH endonuclease [Bacteroidetes bacterium HGW-Bacteroidetes-9]|nr:MAG: HNH endonuclease [Bacteroidetes bacterium HGW-Bacteroidetes-9]